MMKKYAMHASSDFLFAGITSPEASTSQMQYIMPWKTTKLRK